MLIAALLIALAFCLTACRESDESKYNRANKLLNEGKYDDAVKLFDEIGTYEDTSRMFMYAKAVAAFEHAGQYSDAKTQILETRYQEASAMYQNGDYASAYVIYKEITDYKDVANLMESDEHLLSLVHEADPVP